MHFSEARFITSAPDIGHCPAPDLPEICFAGRSNVGKSSLINALLNRNNLARTSNVPGKTREINYYEVDRSWYLVDLPGYGYAKVPKVERERWQREIDRYLIERENLNLIIQIIDIRHDPTPLDVDFTYWLAEYERPFSIVLSKSDKIGVTQRANTLAAVQKSIEEMNIEVPVLAVSAETGFGIDQLRELITDFAGDKYIKLRRET
jgi:GTP-binding protein